MPIALVSKGDRDACLGRINGTRTPSATRRASEKTFFGFKANMLSLPDPHEAAKTVERIDAADCSFDRLQEVS